MSIICKGITKTFGKGETAVEALRGIDLEVKDGELFMLVGPSGSGKTTLLSIIAGILQPTAGECIALGEPLESMSEHERVQFRKKGVGFVFQSFHLIPALTAEENVSIPLLLQGVERREAIKRSRAILEEVGLGKRGKAMPAELSGGERQRVAISRAIIHEPPLVICDEPTSALDHETGQRVLEVFRSSVRKKGRSLIIVTHDARIFDYADQIAKMDDGRIIK